MLALLGWYREEERTQYDSPAGVFSLIECKDSMMEVIGWSDLVAWSIRDGNSLASRGRKAEM